MAAKKKSGAKKKINGDKSAAERNLAKAKLVSSKRLTAGHRKKIAKLSPSEVKALVSARKKLGKGSLHGSGADFF